MSASPEQDDELKQAGDSDYERFDREAKLVTSVWIWFPGTELAEIQRQKLSLPDLALRATPRAIPGQRAGGQG